MARQITEVIVSDLSGNVVPKGEAVRMILEFEDGRRSKYQLDLSQQEAQPFIEKGTEIKKRGRRPGSRNKPKAES